MNCSRCGADNPPTDRYCGQCGKALAEPTKLGRTVEAVGWLMMVSGTVILALAALYHIIPLASTTDQGSWSAPPLLNSLLGHIFFLSGEGYHWPGLTVGALLGVIGIVVWGWLRVRIPGRSGKGIKALLLIGGLIISMGAIIGTFPVEMWLILTPAGQVPSGAISGQFAFFYMGLVLTGFAIILGAMAWASWKERRWGLPSRADAEGDEPIDKVGDG